MNATTPRPVNGATPNTSVVNGSLYQPDPLSFVKSARPQGFGVDVELSTSQDGDDQTELDLECGDVADAVANDASVATSTRINDSSPPSIDVVHEALKGAEYGFNLGVAGLEKEARRLGREWADHGLPRHDLDREEPIEAELVLAQRAGEIYATWIRRARQKVDAAIAHQRELLDRALERGQRVLDTHQDAEKTIQQLAPRSTEGTAAATSSETASASSGYAATAHVLPRDNNSAVLEPLVTTTPPDAQLVAEHETRVHGAPIRLARREFGPSFWLLAFVLVLAEFVANAPVFAEIFPLSREVEARVTTELTDSTTSVWLYGLQDAALRLLASPEPAFLALAVVTFLLFLGHHVGGEARTLVVLRESIDGVAHDVIRRARRQAFWACVCSLVGVAIMALVLFKVREQVAPMAEQRLQTAAKQLDAARQDVSAAQAADEGPERIAQLRDVVYNAEDEHTRRSARMDYASSLDGANAPIAGMNLVLAIVAALAGYFRKELELPRLATERAGTVRGTPTPTPVASSRAEHDHHASASATTTETAAERHQLAARLDELRQAMRTSRQQLDAAIADGDRAYAAATQLLHCNPTAKWEGMVRRLECAVPVFRSENALARKLDPLDIKGFRTPAGLALAAPDERTVRVDVLEGVEAAHERLQALRAAAVTLGLHGRVADRIVEPGSQGVVS